MKTGTTIISSLATAAVASAAVYMLTSSKPTVKKMRKKAVKGAKNMVKNSMH